MAKVLEFDVMGWVEFGWELRTVDAGEMYVKLCRSADWGIYRRHLSRMCRCPGNRGDHDDKTESDLLKIPGKCLIGLGVCRKSPLAKFVAKIICTYSQVNDIVHHYYGSVVNKRHYLHTLIGEFRKKQSRE